MASSGGALPVQAPPWALPGTKNNKLLQRCRLLAFPGAPWRCSAWRRHRRVVMLFAARQNRRMMKGDASQAERLWQRRRGQLGEPPVQMGAAHQTLGG